MSELRFASQQNPAEHIVEQGDALTARVLEIVNVERREVRSDTKMLGVVQHHVQKTQEWLRQALAEGGSYRENLKGPGIATIPTHADGFIEIDTKHGIGGFETLERS
jgi:hypothetical protein